MYESGVNSEGVVDYNLLFCQACLSSNRDLTTVGDYMDVYLKICENSRLNKASQINLCWECMALLKKVRAFKKKVENAQKILDYHVNKQAPLEDSLSNLTTSSVEVTTFISILVDDDQYEYDNVLDTHTYANDDLDKSFGNGDSHTYTNDDLDKSFGNGDSHTYANDDLDKSFGNGDLCEKDVLNKSVEIIEEYEKELNKSVGNIEDTYNSTDEPNKLVIDLDDYDPKDELMIKIADVRGLCDIVDSMPVLNVSGSSGCDVRVKVEPLSLEESEEERRYQRWKRSVMLVYKRICGHRYARYFLRPVSDELAPCYSRVVRRPTDLGSIKRRVREGLIRTTKEFRHALLLLFSNALMYNGSQYNIYDMTVELRDETLCELEILEAAEAHANSPHNPPPPPRRRAPSPSVPPPPSPPSAATKPVPARPASPPTLPPARPVSPPSLPAPIRRKRWDWANWPEHEHLLAIKKYKSTVLLEC